MLDKESSIILSQNCFLDLFSLDINHFFRFTRNNFYEYLDLQVHSAKSSLWSCEVFFGILKVEKSLTRRTDTNRKHFHKAEEALQGFLNLQKKRNYE